VPQAQIQIDSIGSRPVFEITATMGFRREIVFLAVMLTAVFLFYKWATHFGPF
jgi:hypothetical protein